MKTDDVRELNALGYAQELFRTMGGFSNFAISFSIISILTGAVTLYSHGLVMGGPAEMAFGWPLVSLFTLAVALSMAELASSMPTSGAMYHWACLLGGKGWGWFTAWFNIVGQLAALAGIDYGCALFVTPLTGLAPTPANVLIVYAAILLSHALINHVGIRLVAWLNDFSVTVHVVGVFAIVGAVWLFAPKQPIGFFFSRVTSNTQGWPYWWAFVVGLLQAQWTFTGYDASASVSEETVDPRRRVPWGIVMAVVVSSIVGYLLLIALTLAIRDIPERAERARRRRPRDPRRDRDPDVGAGRTRRRAGHRAGGDGDVVLRAVGGHLDVTGHLRLRARRRDAGVRDLEAREPVASHARTGDLAVGRRRVRGDDQQRHLCGGDLNQRDRVVRVVHRAGVPGLARARLGEGRGARALAPRAIRAGDQSRRDAVGRLHHGDPRDPRRHAGGEDHRGAGGRFERLVSAVRTAQVPGTGVQQRVE